MEPAPTASGREWQRTATGFNSLVVGQLSICRLCGQNLVFDFPQRRDPGTIPEEASLVVRACQLGIKNQPKRQPSGLCGQKRRAEGWVLGMSIAGPVAALRETMLETLPVSSFSYPFICSVRPS